MECIHVIVDGIPNDGNPIPEVVTVALGLTVVYLILAVAGVVFATVCLVFTLVFRKRKLVQEYKVLLCGSCPLFSY